MAPAIVLAASAYASHPKLLLGVRYAGNGLFRGFELTLQDPGIAVITSNQPERLNGFNQAIKRELVEVMTQIQMDDQVRVVVITGPGRKLLRRRCHRPPGRRRTPGDARHPTCTIATQLVPTRA